MKLKAGTKNVVAGITIILLLITALSTYAISKMTAYANRTERAGLADYAASCALVLNGEIATNFAYLHALSRREDITAEKRGTITEEKWVDIFSKETKASGFSSIAIADKNGDVLRSNGQRINVSDREYFIKAMKGISNVSDVIVSRATNEKIVIYAVPAEYENEKYVVYAVKPASEFYDLITDMKYGDTGYVYIVSRTGVFQSHQNEEFVGVYNPVNDENENTPIRQAINTVLSNKSGITEYFFNERKLFAGFDEISEGDSGWKIVVAIERNELFQDVDTLRWNLLIGSFVSILFSGSVIALYSFRLFRPLKIASSMVENLGELDFRTVAGNDILERRQDEFGAIIRNASKTGQRIKEFARAVQTSADQILEKAQDTHNRMEENSTSLEKTMISMKELKNGAHSTAQASESGTSHAHALKTIFEAVRSKVEIMSLAVNSAERAGENGAKALSVAEKSVEQGGEETARASEAIKATDTVAGNIKKASDMIKSIADKTNLLALNAAIEAARAGEAGRGFAVVASEIRNLAEQSNTFAEEIEREISNLVEQTSEAVHSIDRVSESVPIQKNNMIDSLQKFNEVSKSIEELQCALNGLEEEIHSSEKTGEDLIAIFENIMGLSEEHASSTNEVESIFLDLGKRIDETLSRCVEMSDVARTLEDKLQNIKMD